MMLLMFSVMIAYFCYSVYFYGGRWVTNAHNPRIASGKQSVIMGKVTDRNGTVLAYTDAVGERQYHSSRDTRMAVSQVVGDNGGKVSTGVDTFHAQYLLGFKASVFERISDALTGEPQRGDNLTLTFSPALVDFFIYVIDVAAGDKIPRKDGPGISHSDILVINKIDLAPYVHASLDVMRRDSHAMRGQRPTVMTNCFTGEGIDELVELIRNMALFDLQTHTESTQ